MSIRSRQKLVAAAFLVGVLGLWLIFSGRAASPIGAGSAAKLPSTTSSTLTIDITIADGNVDPSGKQIPASVGQEVTLNVESDIDEELHAHVGLDDYVLRVWGGQTTTARFGLRGPGSFVVESHRLRKTIVILNVR
jgi:hypothetical protein